MSTLLRNLFLLGLMLLSGCARLSGGSGEIFGGGDITRQLLTRIRTSYVVPAVETLANAQEISCDLEAICADHPDQGLCQSRPSFNTTQVQACEFILRSNLQNLLSAVRSQDIALLPSSGALTDNGTPVSAKTTLSPAGPIYVDIARVREQNLRDHEIAALLMHEYLHKIHGLLPGLGFADDEDTFVPFEQARDVLDAIAILVGLQSLRLEEAKNARLMVGTDAGILRTINAKNKKLDSDVFQQLDAFSDGAAPAIASGDLNGDGVSDLVVASAVYASIVAIDGKSGAQLASWPGLGAGSSVAVGDINGDGRNDVVVGAPPGPVNSVIAYDNLTQVRLHTYAPYNSGFTSGVYVAAGDVNGDGRDEILTGARKFGGPHVKVYDAVAQSYYFDQFAYNIGYTGGVSVAAGDLNGDGRDEIITGAANDGGPHVRAWDVLTGAEVYSAFPYDPYFVGGVIVASGDLDGDGIDEILTVPRRLENLPVRAWNARNGEKVFEFALPQGATGPRTLAFIE